MISRFSASGKLLLFGEYLVLRGSNSLGIPLKTKQELEISAYPENGLYWISFEEEKLWLEIKFSSQLEIISTTDEEKARIIQRLLRFILEQNKDLKLNYLRFKFSIDFQREFGFGTSSTLISLLSQWSGVDPYLLLENSFGGSGYDVAMAIQKIPAIYSMKNRVISTFILPEIITSKILFIYLGNKQNSGKEIQAFKEKKVSLEQIQQMNNLIQQSTTCQNIEEWEFLMNQSEDLLAPILGFPKVKDVHFLDYPHSIKSLGAWGGDFIMATYRNLEEAQKYFESKHKNIFFTWNELIY